MGWLWDILVDDDDFVRRIQREIKRSEIIIEIERKIDVQLPATSSNVIKQQIEQILRDYHGSMGTKSADKQEVQFSLSDADLKRITQELILKLRQEIHEEISRSQVESGNNTNLQSWIDAQNRENEALKRSFVAQAKNYDAIKSAFDLQVRENAVLKQQVSQQEQRLLNLDEQNELLGQELTEAKHQLDLLQKQVADLIGDVSTPTPIPKPSIPPVVPWSKSFSLPKPATATAFFRGDGEGAKAKLAQSIQDMDALIIYLSQSKIEEPARTSFMKNLRWCMESLKKLYEKFDFIGCDADELSEELTEKFFKIICENLLDNVMVAIYRGGKNVVGYSDFLQNINLYLSKYGIYTQDIVPGMKIKRDMISNIEPPIAKQTPIASDDGKVDEVELLPYFMYYEDDDGNLETVRKRGRVVCLKYGA